MKIACLSDIHGNAVALDAVLEDVKRQNVDKIVVLGDIAYRGPEPARAIDLVRSQNAEVIKGNADEWVVRGVKSGEVPDKALELMQTEQAWVKDQLSEDQLQYLANLPTEISLSVDGITIHGFHATPNSLFDAVLPDQSDNVLLDTLTKAKEADLYLYGHIHKSYERTIDGKTIMNLGSIGLPFDGIPKASYAIADIHHGQVETSHVRVPYDIEKVCKQYEDYDYPNIKMMQQIIRSGKN
ncbi:phosphodiesterase [Gracilibacillus halophilus YIM-C55.5]|uniref:Phosphodiesterase n=1 Tax=Gracilibacillus halophilus YIM-C55.5 TaxID=1308866 RepID=N4W836_9BACI|nr:metallophosphoesterase family protein [Gracilibacillus halophilus]ENH96433.1 phosphodiesterase [Gracilibacillus halophilus YIM-C55.5]